MIKIGTSGWSYNHWYSRFYPRKLSREETLKYYQTKFDTVEINVSFYRLVPKQTFENWRKKVDANFLFAVKASRYITHIKRLKTCEEPLHRFISSLKGLGKNIGPILFQLPPNFKKDLLRLEIFAASLPKKFRYAFEFRDDSWFVEDVYSVLRKYNLALVMSHGSHFPFKKIVTTNFIYLRFHGSGALYSTNYSDQQLTKWHFEIIDWLKDGKDVFAYFNNDNLAYAPKNALKLKELIFKSLGK